MRIHASINRILVFLKCFSYKSITSLSYCIYSGYIWSDIHTKQTSTQKQRLNLVDRKMSDCSQGFQRDWTCDRSWRLEQMFSDNCMSISEDQYWPCIWEEQKERLVSKSCFIPLSNIDDTHVLLWDYFSLLVLPGYQL